MPTNWETADILNSPMEICWQFDYEISREKLKNLYSKSKKLQWDAERDLDWSIEVDPSKPMVSQARNGLDRLPLFQKLSATQRETFVAHATAHQLSQFLHGEQGALMTAAALTHAAPDYEGKLYAATQTMDEARHVEAYEMYIQKLAIVYPISPWLKAVIDDTLLADHWVKIAIGMNMVVEGLALGAFHNMRRTTTCDLLRQLTELVLRDESRHVAFGNLYVRETLAEMHEDQREDVAQFAFEVIQSIASAIGGVDGTGTRKPDPGFLRVLDQVGIDHGDFLRAIIEAGAAGMRAEVPAGQVHSFKDLMMPALVRVGAVTDRSRALFAEAGIPVWDDLSVIESMEDANSGDLSTDPQLA
ncbi:MAG: ferritin-like domain-containing protein [Myxococcota bacterium]|nr:ferritin-like domain-containing protein [Myxococcota bacterium]